MSPEVACKNRRGRGPLWSPCQLTQGAGHQGVAFGPAGPGEATTSSQTNMRLLQGISGRDAWRLRLCGLGRADIGGVRDLGIWVRAEYYPATTGQGQKSQKSSIHFYTFPCCLVSQKNFQNWIKVMS